jgi:hypothetical protein
MTFLAVVLPFLLAAAGERPALVVQAPDAPVRLDRAAILTPAEGPPVLLYSATSQIDGQLDQFTVIAYVFDAEGKLKARQTAPSRHLLDAGTTKYSTLVLDGSPVAPTDVIVVGINQAQRVGSDTWWRADLQPAAEAAVPRKKP